MKLFLIAIVTALAACAPEPANDGNAVAMSRSPAIRNATVGRAATPAPPAADPATLTAEGWGPLRIGMTRAEVVTALGEDASPGAVGGPDPAMCDQFRPERAPKAMLVMVERGVLTHVALTAPSDIATDRGITVGDSVTKLRAAYAPADLRAAPHAYQEKPAEYLTAWVTRAPGNARQPSDRGITYEINADGVVGSISGGGPSIEYVEGCL